MPNEVRILVRTQNSTKAGFEAVDKEVEAFSKRSSETFARNFSDNLTRNLSQNLTQHLRTVGQQVDQSARTAGDRIGETMSRSITNRITERVRNTFRSGDSRSTSSARSGGLGDGNDRDRVHVDVDVDRQSLLQRITGLGKQAGEKFSDTFGEGFKTSITSVFSGDMISTILKSFFIALGTTVIAPALGAAITSGVLLALGGGVIGAGVVAAFQNPQIMAGAKELLGRIKALWTSFGENFTGPVANFLEGILGVIKQITPMAQHLGQIFGPVADQLGHGIVGMLQNMLPAILRATEAAAPLIKVLADEMPDIGDALGRFFDDIKDGAPGAVLFFKDLLNGIELVIRVLGKLILALTTMYGVVRTVIGETISLFLDWASAATQAAALAFGWMPGLGPKLNAAAQRMGEFKTKWNNYLRQMPSDKTITVHFRVVGLAAASAAVRTAQILHNMGFAHGGVKGAASGGNQSGLTWVGEQGPELVQLPAGSRVNTAGDSARMMANAGQGGGGAMNGTLRLAVDRTTERGVIDALFRMFRAEINNLYGGNVQTALGS